jgi:cytochrome c553
VRVVEATTIPAFALGCFAYVTVPGEPVALGEHIIEVPDDLERFERRDPHVGFTAYVPVGSVARGRRLTAEARGTTPACATCHGPDLRGGPAAPPLAGRYPGYLFRQLLGFRAGSRTGGDSATMRAIVTELSETDMIAAAAFAASQAP